MTESLRERLRALGRALTEARMRDLPTLVKLGAVYWQRMCEVDAQSRREANERGKRLLAYPNIKKPSPKVVDSLIARLKKAQTPD
jgi:hypothetical protein